MHNFKHFIIKFISLIIFGHIIISADASHYAGGYISTEHIQDRKYRIIIEIYRDCSGVSWKFTSSTKFGYYFTNSNLFRLTAITNLTPTLVRITKIPGKCSNQKDSGCFSQNNMSGNYLGMELIRLEDTVDFNSNSTIKNNYENINHKAVVFYYEDCCRTSALTTINGGTSIAQRHVMYLHDFGGKRIEINNNSPRLFSSPFFGHCVNRSTVIDAASFDKDGMDSIKYLLSPVPVDLSMFSATYYSPFTYKYPVTPYCPTGGVSCTPNDTASTYVGFKLDTNSGKMTFTPTKSGEVSAISLEINEYRSINGSYKLISKSSYEIHLIIISNCGYNNQPRITSALKSHYQVLYNKALDIKINTNDNRSLPNQTIQDTTRIKIFGAQGNLKYTRNTPFRVLDSGRFTYSPSKTDAGNQFSILIQVSDNHCPTPSYDSKLIKIRVHNPFTKYKFVTFLDRNRNCTRDAGEPLASGVYLHINGTSAPRNAYITTNSSGAGDFTIEKDSAMLDVLPFGDYFSTCGKLKLKFIGDTSISYNIPVNTIPYIKGAIYSDNNLNCTFNSTSDRLGKNEKVTLLANNHFVQSNDSGIFKIYLPDSGFYDLAIGDNDTFSRCNVVSKIKNIKVANNSFVDLGLIPIYTDSFDADIFNVKNDLARPGRNYKIEFEIRNNLSLPLKGKYGNRSVPKLILKYSPKMHWRTAAGASVDTINNIIQWTANNLLYKESQKFSAVFYLHPDSFVLNEEINQFIYLDTNFVDYNLNNNQYRVSQNILRPFDPNNKYSINRISSNDRIQYRVNFQNFGNDTAFNVLLIDTLSNNLDVRNLSIIESSSKCLTKLEKNILHLYFPGINLSDTTTSLEGSKGFVKFDITYKSNYISNPPVITNRAAIYFDFEKPIFTNTDTFRPPYFIEKIQIPDDTIICSNGKIRVHYNSNYFGPRAIFEVQYCDHKDDFTKVKSLGTFTSHLPGRYTLDLFIKYKTITTGTYKLRIIPKSKLHSTFVEPLYPVFRVLSPENSYTMNKPNYCPNDSVFVNNTGNDFITASYIGKATTLNKSGLTFIGKAKRDSIIRLTTNLQNTCFFYDSLKPVIFNNGIFNAAFKNDTICRNQPAVLQLSGNYKFNIALNNQVLFNNVIPSDYNINFTDSNSFITISGYSMSDCLIPVILSAPRIENPVNLKFAELLDDSVCKENQARIKFSSLNKFNLFESNSKILENVSAGIYMLPANLQNNLLAIGSSSRGCFDTNILSKPTIHNIDISLSIKPEKTNFCLGDAFEISWPSLEKSELYENNNLLNTSDFSHKINLSAAGNYNYVVKYKDRNNCNHASNTKTVIVFNNPAKPYVSKDSISLKSSSTYNNLWHSYSNPINVLDTNNYFSPKDSDFYFVSVFNPLNPDCRSTSDTIHFIPPRRVNSSNINLGLSTDIQISPNPFFEDINISAKSGISHVSIFTATNKLIFSKGFREYLTNYKTELATIPDGVYFIIITDHFGKKHFFRAVKQQ